MNRSHFAALALAIVIAAPSGIAQSQRPMPLGQGDLFPQLDVYDADGNPFNTRSLAGTYTVLVSGCLT